MLPETNIINNEFTRYDRGPPLVVYDCSSVSGRRRFLEVVALGIRGVRYPNRGSHIHVLTVIMCRKQRHDTLRTPKVQRFSFNSEHDLTRDATNKAGTVEFWDGSFFLLRWST